MNKKVNVDMFREKGHSIVFQKYLKNKCLNIVF